MKNKKELIILLRVPFLDKIPSLKSLIIYFAKKNYKITIISSTDDKYVAFDFDSTNIHLKLVKSRTKKIGIPTSIKLLAQLFKILLKKKRIYCIIGGDNYANLMLSKLNILFKIPYINFLLEYPELGNRSEYIALIRSSFIITHDKWHGDFLQRELRIDPSKMLYLPNASYTPQYYKHETYLYDKLDIPINKNIILHSGGIGDYFMSKDLISIAQSWSDKNILVFHTSYDVKKTSYYCELKEILDEDHIKFSTNPVSNDILDKLVSSARIGLALYSEKILGYRAVYMGLAAGKIGNYLKCGIPVIASKLPSLCYIEEYKCGILIDNLNQIENSIATINNNYEEYVQNAHKCYAELWEPQKYLESIRKKIF